VKLRSTRECPAEGGRGTRDLGRHTARSSQLEVQLGGQAIEQTEKVSIGTATAVGLVAAIVVLLITFGSLLHGSAILTRCSVWGRVSGSPALLTVISTPDFATQLAP